MRIKKLILSVLSIVALGVLIYLGSLYVAHDYDANFLSIDTCIDDGGCWDFAETVCRIDEINAQKPCARSQSNEFQPWIFKKQKKLREEKIPMH